MGAIYGLNRVEGKLNEIYKDKVFKIIEACQMAQSLIKREAQRIVPTDTHALQNSIQEGRIFFKDNVVTASVYALQSYASYVEEGTWKMKARPYLRPAMEMHKDTFIKLLARAVKS